MSKQCFCAVTQILCFNSQGKPAKWRDFHSATAVGTSMYIFGGRGKINCDWLNRNWDDHILISFVILRSSHNIHMFHSFHGYDESIKLACSQRMGLHSSVGGALQR